MLRLTNARNYTFFFGLPGLLHLGHHNRLSPTPGPPVISLLKSSRVFFRGLRLSGVSDLTNLVGFYAPNSSQIF